MKGTVTSPSLNTPGNMSAPIMLPAQLQFLSPSGVRQPAPLASAARRRCGDPARPRPGELEKAGESPVPPTRLEDGARKPGMAVALAVFNRC